MKKSPPWTDAGAKRIAAVIHRVQLKFTRTMNRLFMAVPKTKRKLLVIVFGFLSGGFCMYLITKAIVRTDASSVRIDNIRVPVPIDDSIKIYHLQK